MKNFKIFALAAAAMILGLTSCSKDNNGESNEAPAKINVSLNFKNVATRANSAPAAKEDKVTIQDGYICFTNGDVITDVYTIKTNASPTPADKEIEAAGLGATPTVINNVPGTSTDITMIVNKGTLAAAPAVGGSMASYMGNAMVLADQGDYTKVTATGSAALTPKPSGTATEKVANVTLRTDVARIQLKNIVLGSAFTAGVVEGIFINGYYSSMKLDGTAVGALISSTTNTDYIDNSLKFPTSAKTFAYDYGIFPAGFASTITPSLGAWGYNLFASATPQIIIKLSGMETALHTYSGDQFVTIDGFNKGGVNIDDIVGGMIYTIAAGDIVIKPEHLSVTPGLKPMSVDVTVTTVEWDETIVKPNL